MYFTHMYQPSLGIHEVNIVRFTYKILQIIGTQILMLQID